MNETAAGRLPEGWPHADRPHRRRMWLLLVEIMAIFSGIGGCAAVADLASPDPPPTATHVTVDVDVDVEMNACPMIVEGS